MKAPLPLRTAGNVVVGPIVWAAFFLAVYASESLFCRSGAQSGHDTLVAGVTAAALLAVFWHGVRMSQRGGRCDLDRQLRGIALGLDVLAATGIALVVASALALSACT